MDIGKRIKEELEREGLTQSELAEKAGVNRGALNCYIKGKYSPKQPTIAKLAEALGVSESYLMYGTESTDIQLSRDEVEMINLYRELSPQLKDYTRMNIKVIQRQFESPIERSDDDAKDN